MASNFAEPALHNFRTLWSIPADVSLTAAQNCLPVAGKCFNNNVEMQTAVTSGLQTLAVKSYDTGTRTLVHRYETVCDL